MGKREIHTVFDLVFKALMKLSGKLVIYFINGIFRTDYPPDSIVEYPSTEHIARDLDRRYSDMLILIGGKYLYHLEAEIEPNAEIVLRMFQYGFRIGEERKQTAKDKNGNRRTVIHLPQAKILYWETTRRTPDRETLSLIFPDGTIHDYTVDTFKVLEHPVAELEQEKLFLLIPFHILKLRKTVKAAAPGEERRRLAEELRELYEELVKAVKRNGVEGLLAEEEEIKIRYFIEILQRQVYTQYEEISEGLMLKDIVVENGEIRYPWELKAERDAAMAELALAAKKANHETARNFRALGVSNETIAAGTGLSLEEVEKL
jgi:hypothetical protein